VWSELVWPKGKRPLRRPRRRWVDNIKLDLAEIGWGGVDCFGLAKRKETTRKTNTSAGG
jgi:hypothetical protein